MADAATVSPEADAAPSNAVEWLDIIEKSERAFEAWRTRARKIIKTFTEQRRETDKTKRRYAMLWANTSTLQPVVYARTPQPVVIRRFKDKDKVAKQAGEVVERSLVYTLDKTNFDSMMKNVRDDYLLAGRGTSWVRYEADIAPQIDPATGEQAIDAEGKPAEQINDERVIADYVNWSDFGHTIARRWEEVTAVWRKVYMDRPALVKRFGKEIGNAIGLDHKPDSNDAKDRQLATKNKATVYEIWDKAGGLCIWVAKGYANVCDQKPPLLELENFFPCPRPSYSTMATDSLIPIPDYVYYQDQAEQIDDITAKIDRLTDPLKLVGFYPAGVEGTAAIIKALKPDSTDMLIPIAGWNAFAKDGGVAQIQWVPVDMVIKVLQGCHENRQLLIQDIYQITGLSDIVRGESNPEETATAQNLKSQWGSVRVRDRQQEIQRFARDTIRIMGEVIAEKFQPETLLKITGLPLPTQVQVEQQAQQQAVMAQQAAAQAPPPMQPPGPPQAAPSQPPQPDMMGHNGGPPMPPEPPITIDAVVELLHNEKLRCYRLDIETDSTIAPDEQADKESWNELLTAVGGFMTQAMPMGQQVPELVPVLGEMLLATVRKYRAGKSLEDAVETAIEQISAKAKASMSAPPPPNPDLIKVQGQLQVGNQKAQAASQKAQIDGAAKAQDMQLQREEFAMDHTGKQLDRVHQQEAHQMKMQQMQMAAQRPPQTNAQ